MDRGLVLVIGKDVGWYGLWAGRHLGQSIGCLVELSQDMIELKAVELVFQFLDLVVVGGHFSS
jgi:hypothetical protein